MLDLPAREGGTLVPAPEVSQRSDDSSGVAVGREPRGEDTTSPESPRKVSAGFFATFLPSEKTMQKWLLSSLAYPPAREAAGQAPSIKPVPTPSLPPWNEDRPGVTVETQARWNDSTSRKVAGERVRSKSADRPARENEARAAGQAPSVRPIPNLPVPLAVETQARRADATSPTIDDLFLLPQAARRRSYSTLISFVLCVILPTLAVAAYLYHYASDEYYAEFRFSVQQGTPVLPGTSPSTVAASGGSSSSPSSLGGSASSVSVAMPQNFMVNDYLTSQKVVGDLQSRINVKALYSKPEINWLERFDAREPMEKFVTYFHRFFWADYDQVTGVAIATVKAFTPQDALLVAKTLAALSENLINEMNVRADGDAVRFAEEESERAEKRLNDARARLLEFRSKAGVINPSSGVAPSVLTKEQLVQIQRHVAQDTGGAHAFADVIGTYEKILFDQQYAQDSLVRARQAADLARANAAVQHFYIEPYVTPELPESPAYPMRALDTCLAGLAIFGAWLLGVLLVRTIKDHAV